MREIKMTNNYFILEAEISKRPTLVGYNSKTTDR